MIVICGGGTGGHLAIAKSFCNFLNKKGIKTIFIGSTKGQDKMWFEHDKNFCHKYFLQSQGVVNKSGIAKFISLLNIIKLALKCKKIFKDHNVKAVISVGGYSAAPASIYSIISKTPLYIHEQNAIIGKLNSILKPFSKGFYSSYKQNPDTYPINEKFFNLRRVRENIRCILFLGGSQGAKAINELCLKLAPSLKENGIKIIHQCGKNSLDELKDSYKKININLQEDVILFDFSDKIENFMNQADVAISRAGASSLWELCANGLPCIFVPFPKAAKNHQYHNAKFLLDQELCKICLQNKDEINKDEILNSLQNYNIKKCSEKLINLIDKKNTSEVIDKILIDLNLN